MWSWLTGSGYFKQDEFDGDGDRLTDFYHDHGYLDFEVKDVKLEHPTTNTMIVKYYLFEGHQYKVGSVKFTGETIFTNAEIVSGLEAIQKLPSIPRPSSARTACRWTPATSSRRTG